jgi:hypothetical protein
VLELIKQPTQHYFAKVIRKLLLLEPATSYISGDVSQVYLAPISPDCYFADGTRV